MEWSWLEDQQRVWQRSASTCVFAKVTRVDGSKLMVMYFESRIILQSSRWSMHRVAISHVQSSLCWFSPYAIRALQACKCFFCANRRSKSWEWLHSWKVLCVAGGNCRLLCHSISLHSHCLLLSFEFQLLLVVDFTTWLRLVATRGAEYSECLEGSSGRGLADRSL